MRFSTVGADNEKMMTGERDGIGLHAIASQGNGGAESYEMIKAEELGDGVGAEIGDGAEVLLKLKNAGVGAGSAIAAGVESVEQG